MKKETGFFAEFRKFIARGNVMDMAVGVIIGGAFKGIADSLSADILMPILGIFTGRISFSELSFQLGSAVITYGNFIQSIISFLIMALVVFCFLRAVNNLHAKKEAAPSAPAAPSKEELLLTEIRDLLKEQGKQ
ncbi:MAG: large-conductance mechanosensitive channel protein MscL [Oscillibacter sp.]|jgi:large conductance mechanosensitive channel|nr:large-conductance mechanosensitive channel protein MscL [Oscillibacter sp.]